jgi:hypothetical protein
MVQLPPNWTPPEPTMPAAFGVANLIVSIVIGVAILVGVLAGVGGALRGARAGGGGLPSIGGFDVNKLASVSLKATPESMANLTGSKVDDSYSMRVPLSGSGYDAVIFTWDKLDTTHVKQFSLYSSNPLPNEADVRKRLAAVLGRRFEKGENFNWGGAYLYFSTNSVGGHADLKTSDPLSNAQDPHTANRLDAIWDVVRSAVLGLKVPVTDAERRDLLGGGYPLKALASLDITTDVDGAIAAMQKALPGATWRVISGIDFTVPLDHPWFGQASFDWPNEKGGRVSQVRIGAPAGQQYLQNQADVEKCIAGAYGPGKITSEDHLKGTHNMEFKIDQGELRVDQYSVDITVLDSMAAHVSKDQWKSMGIKPPMDQAAWTKVMTTLDACGRR